jgi:hypothetical protein
MAKKPDVDADGCDRPTELGKTPLEMHTPNGQAGPRVRGMMILLRWHQAGRYVIWRYWDRTA